MTINIDDELNFLFSLNRDRSDYIIFIKDYSLDYGEHIANLINFLKKRSASKIPEKFQNLGFNENSALFDLESRLNELKLGQFLIHKGERVEFIEGKNSPDLISGHNSFNRIWEVATAFNQPQLEALWIEADKIIKKWDLKVKTDIYLSQIFNEFRPRRDWHEILNQIVNISLNNLNNFNASDNITKDGGELVTPGIIYRFKLSNSNFSGISNLIESGLEQMGWLETSNYIKNWVEYFETRIIEKSRQLDNNILISEQTGNYRWDNDSFRLIALITKADVLDREKYVKQTCFGVYDNWGTTDLDDNRIRDIEPSDPWYDYVKENFYYYSNVLKRPKGVFLKRVTRKIHGILFLRPMGNNFRHQFKVNPFVQLNNDPNLLNYLT